MFGRQISKPTNSKNKINDGSKTVPTAEQETQQTQERIDFWEEKKHYKIFEVTSNG